jgi:hypothetical protein
MGSATLLVDIIVSNRQCCHDNKLTCLSRITVRCFFILLSYIYTSYGPFRLLLNVCVFSLFCMFYWLLVALKPAVYCCIVFRTELHDECSISEIFIDNEFHMLHTDGEILLQLSTALFTTLLITWNSPITKKLHPDKIMTCHCCTWKCRYFL